MQRAMYPAVQEPSAKVLADQLRNAPDFAAFSAWSRGPAQEWLPHRGLFCAQFSSHSGGYACRQNWSVGVPSAYLGSISRAGKNLRSPIFERLLQEGGKPQFFDTARHAAHVPPDWLLYFKRTGWRTLALLAHTETQGDERLLSIAGFYGVASAVERDLPYFQQMLMPHIHATLSRFTSSDHVPFLTAETAPRAANSDWAPLDKTIVRLMATGQTNKEIAKTLGKSDHTIKHRLTDLMHKLQVTSRAAVVSICATRKHPAVVQESSFF
jgi:DNA-binding CsgD family transcriptional regulator